MSTFVLRREYSLRMPTSYVDIDRDEMEYVDGGVYISNDQLKAAVFAVVGSGATASMIAASAYGIAGLLAISIPGVGLITGAVLCLYAGTFGVVAFNAIMEGKGMHIRLAFPWGLSFEVG